MSTPSRPVTIQASRYYIHRDYVPTYYYIYQGVHDWLSENIFRNDKTRVFLSSNEFAFRRRFELTDMSKRYSDISVSSLQLPFANYWPQNTGWQPDTRPAANSAALLYSGIYEGDTVIRASAVTMSIPVTFYFDREDDARLAYDTLFYFTFNERNYSTTAHYAGNELGLPINITVDRPSFNPQFKEQDWLNRNRIFVVTTNLNVRSYILMPPVQPNWDQEIEGIDKGVLTNGESYDDINGTENFNLTEEVIHHMMNFDDDLLSTDIVRGVVNESDIEVDFLRVKDTTTSSITVEWEVTNPEKLDYIEVSYDVNGVKTYTLGDNVSQYSLVNLSPGATYNIVLNFVGKDGVSKRLYITATTKSKTETKAEDPNLVGLSW